MPSSSAISGSESWASRVSSTTQCSLPKSAQDILYHVSRIENKGRPLEQINLSIAGLEHLCLMADTPEGRQIRQYFIEAGRGFGLLTLKGK